MQGLYLATFVTSLGHGRAFLAAIDSDVLGGDAHFCFTGTLKRTSKFISISLKVRQHTPGRESVLKGLTEYELNLTGPLPGLRLAGRSPQRPDISSTVILERAPSGGDADGWLALTREWLAA